MCDKWYWICRNTNTPAESKRDERKHDASVAVTAALYEAVVHRAFEQALLPLDSVVDQQRGRSALVRALVTDTVTDALRGLPPATHLRIITAEILRPTGTLQSVVGDAMGMRTPQLARRVQALTESSAETRSFAAGALVAWFVSGGVAVGAEVGVW